MRLIFLGTPAFAVPTLEAIVKAGHEVAAVLTQPDRPRGRGQNAAASPVKQAALGLGLTVYQPERVRRPEAVEYLRGMGCDAMVVVGYGQIIPQVVIDLAPLGIINVHASLLPKYRGAGPIQWAIVRGETRTGVTTMRIDAGLDTGDMLLKAETEIGPEENAVELGRRLAAMGADLLVETLEGLRAGRIVPEKQDDAQATLAPLLKKEDGAIDWSRAGAGHPQSRARPAALAGRADQLSGGRRCMCGRPGARVARGSGAADRGPPTGARPVCQPETPGGGLRRRRPGTSRSATGRPQADLGRGFRQRAALDGQ